MTAGRELDELIAEKVMGLVPCSAWGPWRIGGSFSGPEFVLLDGCPHNKGEGCYPAQSGPPEYSVRIGAAWGVVEKFVPHIRVECCATSEYYGGGKKEGQPCPWHCDIWTDGRPVHCITAETAPLAICLAALKAVGVVADEVEA